MRSHPLRAEKPHLLKYFLYKQQKSRQLDIVKPAKYIFALASSKEGMVNTFSIQRFLQKEKIEACDNIYVDSAILYLDKIEDLSLASLQEHKDAFTELKENQRQLKQSASLLSKLMNKPQKIKDNILKLKQKQHKLKKMHIRKLCGFSDVFPSLIVYLEFESLISINHKEYHYAFPTGKNGMTRLPILIQIPEDKASFDLQSICNGLNFDLNLANQKSLETI